MNIIKFPLLIIAFLFSTILYSNHEVPPSTLNSGNPFFDFLDDRTCFEEEKVELELFIMSQCQFANEAQKKLIPILKQLGDKVKLKVNYIGSVNKDGTINLLFGEEEINEDLIQISVLKNTPESFLDYLEVRSSFPEKPANTILNELGLPTEQILEYAQNKSAWNELRTQLDESFQRKIYTSPSLFMDKKEIDRKMLFMGCNSNFCCACVNGTGGSGPGSLDCGDLCAGQMSAVAEVHNGPGWRFCGGSCENTNQDDSCGNSCGAGPCDLAANETCQDCECIAPLPVDLGAFSLKINLDAVELLWTTYSESNTSYFEIQKSSDGLDWSSVGRTEAKGESTSKLDYIFVDERPSLKISYYRLKIVDNDETFSFSPVKSIFLDSDSSIKIFPNPSTGVFEIDFSFSQKQKVTVEVLNVMGQMVQTISDGEEMQEMKKTITINDKGIFYVRIIAGSRKSVQRIVVF